MKHLLLSFVLVLSTVAYSQTKSDLEKFRQEQKASLAQYKQEKKDELKQYRDSINAEYANYLEETWKDFDLLRQDMGFKPMPQPPVYDPSKPQPDNEPQPIPIAPAVPVEPQPLPEPIEPPLPPPAPVAPEYPVVAEFFGTEIRLSAFSLQEKLLLGVSEKEIADYWRFLSNLSISEWVNDVLRIRQELKLNDWGVYQLTDNLFKVYFPTGTKNEQVIFSVFLLDQLEYRAKIGKAGNELYPLIAFQNNVSNTSYFSFSEGSNPVKYYVLNPQHKNIPSIQTCGHEYGNEGNALDISITQQPDFHNKTGNQNLEFENNTYAFEYNPNLTDFYATYPCVDFAVYANAPLDKQWLESLHGKISPQLAGKTQEEAVNWLLHFVQNAFEYKTDDDQFGYEKWNFAEETLISKFSDCDDRAIFFTQLVKNLLGMKVVLIHYPGVHLATAVKFDNPNTTGRYVTVDGANYLICDPTYINANLGMAMPDIGNTIEVIKIK